MAHLSSQPPRLPSFATRTGCSQTTTAVFNMSAWERARHIPWDRIPSDGHNLEEQKEAIFRELQRETIEEELLLQDRRSAPSATEDGVAVETKASSTKIPFSTMELFRQAAFGGTIGSITGAVFGFMDSMRGAGESQVLLKASNAAKGRFILQGTTRSAMLFGGFFSGYHVTKYGLRVAVDPGEIPEIVLAAGLSLSALAYKPSFRPSVPYAVMLVGMDSFNLIMRRSGN